MPETIYTHDEFALATIDGRDVGLVPVQLELDYFRDGSWRVTDCAIVRSAIVDGRVVDTAEWDIPADLSARIHLQALNRYRSDIDDFVFGECEATWGGFRDPNAEHRLTYRDVA